MLGVNGCADYRGKPRIDQSLAAYDDKDALLARVARPPAFHKVQFARFDGSNLVFCIVSIALAVQSPSVTVDNRDVSAIPAGLLQASEIDECGPFQEGGPVRSPPGQPAPAASAGRSDGCLDSHKIIYTPRSRSEMCQVSGGSGPLGGPAPEAQLARHR